MPETPVYISILQSEGRDENAVPGVTDTEQQSLLMCQDVAGKKEDS